MEQERSVREYVSKMTLEEKASLLSGADFWKTKCVRRLGIPSMFLADGPNGIRKQMAASDHLGLNAGVPATCFPAAAAVANSWDQGLGEEIGEYLGEEAAAYRVNILLGPGLNIKRSPLCGRNFEYFSEDPLLSGKMAGAYIRGIQKKGISACPKHFAANSQELFRLSSDSVMDERTLREIYLTGFEIAVKEGQPKAVMSSYNKLNGIYANENEKLLREILVDDWGFHGIVVSDWGGSNDHTQGVMAGNHLEMPGTDGNSDRELVQAVRQGELTEDILNQRVEEYLQVLFACRVEETAPTTFNHKAHHEMACKAAEKSIVLLKNEESILPLTQKTKVAVIGDFAEIPRYQGAGSSKVNPIKLDSPLEIMEKSELKLVGYAAGFERGGQRNPSKKQAACDLAKKSEVVLFYIGLPEYAEAEGTDRKHMKLPVVQLELLKAVASVNPNIVVVLSSGAAVEVGWGKYCKGIVHGYLSGQAGAKAMLRVLTGAANPSGKLSESYPIAYGDTPAYAYFPGKERTAEYRESIFVGYRYYQTAKVKVAYPFGYGLSYTTFEYEDLRADAEGISVSVKNTGDRGGEEVVQLYVSKPESNIFRADRELKGFAKVSVEPGETVRVHIPFDETTFRYYDTETGQFETEAGEYLLMAGASSEDIRLTAAIQKEGTRTLTQTSTLYPKELLPNYYKGSIRNISGKEFEALLGHKAPEAKWNRSKPLGINDTYAQMFYARSFLARIAYRVMTGLKTRSEKKANPDLNITFVYYSPFRSIGKMTGGLFDMEMTKALLVIINGHFLKGIRRLFLAYKKKQKTKKRVTG